MRKSGVNVKDVTAVASVVEPASGVSSDAISSLPDGDKATMRELSDDAQTACGRGQRVKRVSSGVSAEHVNSWLSTP
jgi:hypothetical protein